MLRCARSPLMCVASWLRQAYADELILSVSLRMSAFCLSGRHRRSVPHRPKGNHRPTGVHRRRSSKATRKKRTSLKFRLTRMKRHEAHMQNGWSRPQASSVDTLKLRRSGRTPSLEQVQKIHSIFKMHYILWMGRWNYV